MKPTELDCLLQSLGITPHYLGYCYLKEAVLMAAEDPDRIRHIRRQIYLPIAIRHQVSLESVEKNLRTVRDVVLKHYDPEAFARLLGFQRQDFETLYPRELIFYLSQAYSSLSPAAVAS